MKVWCEYIVVFMSPSWRISMQLMMGNMIQNLFGLAD